MMRLADSGWEDAPLPQQPTYVDIWNLKDGRVPAGLNLLWATQLSGEAPSNASAPDPTTNWFRDHSSSALCRRSCGKLAANQRNAAASRAPGTDYGVGFGRCCWDAADGLETWDPILRRITDTPSWYPWIAAIFIQRTNK
jgi:hypothetical protein